MEYISVELNLIIDVVCNILKAPAFTLNIKLCEHTHDTKSLRMQVISNKYPAIYFGVELIWC